MITFDWGVFFNYINPITMARQPLIWSGLLATIIIAVLSQLIGTAIGVAAALVKLSKIAPLRWLVNAYVTYFRGTPLVVQFVLIFFGSSAIGLYGFPTLEVAGILIPGWMQAAILGLSLNEGAYMAEIIRSGILGVDSGQLEAARALGMTTPRAYRHVVLPQAAVLVLPPLGNEFNGMIKSTSLVVVIGGADLFNAFEQLNARLFQPFELFLAVSVYYLVLTLLWGLVQNAIERRLGRSKRTLLTPPRRGYLGLSPFGVKNVSE